MQSVDPNFSQHLLARQHAPAGKPSLRIVSFFPKTDTSKALYKSRVFNMNLVARGFQQDDSGSDREKSTPWLRIQNSRSETRAGLLEEDDQERLSEMGGGVS